MEKRLIKYFLSIGTVLLMLIGLGAFSNTAKADDTKSSTSSTDTLNVFRLYNPNTGEHFYTTGMFERNSLIAEGWNNEGVGWGSPTTGDAVYRLYNPNAKGGDHYYTVSSFEKDSLLKKGWRYEGIGWYSGGDIDVYVAYNPNAQSGAHNYTIGSTEQNYLLDNGWKYGSTAWKSVSAKVVYATVNYAFDISNINAVTGFSDNVFVAKVIREEGTYQSKVTEEPYTTYRLKVVKKIKGELSLNKPVKIYKNGGIMEDGTMYVFEDDVTLSNGNYYIFTTSNQGVSDPSELPFLTLPDGSLLSTSGGMIPLGKDEAEALKSNKVAEFTAALKTPEQADRERSSFKDSEVYLSE